MRTADLPSALATKIRADDGGCWIWTAALRHGYGQVSIGGRKGCAAHRVVYELLVGPIPTGLELDHLCRVPACVNPAHLEPVTHRENILRGTAPPALHAVKTHCPHGHAYDGKNTHVRPNGSRMCRRCNCLRVANYKRRTTRATH